MRTTLTCTAIQDTLKKVFSDISSTKYITVPAIKEKNWNSKAQLVPK